MHNAAVAALNKFHGVFAIVRFQHLPGWQLLSKCLVWRQVRGSRDSDIVDMLSAIHKSIRLLLCCAGDTTCPRFDQGERVLLPTCKNGCHMPS